MLRAWLRCGPEVAAVLRATASPEVRSHSLENLLLERYRRHGEAFLDDLRGSFAVALHDPQAGIVLLARDGMGTGYLSYALTADLIAAAWDDAPLAALPAVASGYEPLRFSEFYANEEVSGASSFFRGVRAVLPGELLIVGETTVCQRALARPQISRRIELASWEEYVERFAELLGGSVQRQISDLDRVAVLLSGGLDSSPIAALAARELAERSQGPPGTPPVTAVSWRLSHPQSDERHCVEAVAGDSQLALDWVDCDDALPYADLAAWPIHPSSPEQTPYRWFHQRSYSRAAERGCAVILTGFCGDPLYGDARRWAWDLVTHEGLGRTIDRLRTVALRDGWYRVVRHHLIGPLLPRSRSLARGLAPYLTEAARRRLTARPPYPPDLLEARRPRQAERLLALLDANGDHLESHFAALHGIAHRAPLRDFELVEFMLGVPSHLLLQGVETRPVLRAAVLGLVPDAVRLRPGKATFIDVLERGLAAAARAAWAKRLLLDRDALWRGFVAEDTVQRWLLEGVSGNWDLIGLFHCLDAELWRLHRAGGDLGELSATRPTAD